MHNSFWKYLISQVSIWTKKNVQIYLGTDFGSPHMKQQTTSPLIYLLLPLRPNPSIFWTFCSALRRQKRKKKRLRNPIRSPQKILLITWECGPHFFSKQAKLRQPHRAETADFRFQISNFEICQIAFLMTCRPHKITRLRIVTSLPTL